MDPPPPPPVAPMVEVKEGLKEKEEEGESLGKGVVEAVEVRVFQTGEED